MSFGIRAVNRNKRCPICDHADWCGFTDASDGSGAELVICQRSKEDKNPNVIGSDGLFYIRVGTTRSGAGVFREANEYYAYLQDKKNFKKHVSERKVHEKVVLGRADVRSEDFLDKVYRRVLELLPITDEHRDYLKSESWTDELIDYHHIGSLPVADYLRFKHKKCANLKACYLKYRSTVARQIIEELGSVKGVPGFYQISEDDESKWTLSGRSGILFPIYNEYHKIIRLRIKLDYMDSADFYVRKSFNGKEYMSYKKDNIDYYISFGGVFYFDDNKEKVKVKQAKYNNLSSWKENDKKQDEHYIYNRYWNGCESGNVIGLYAKPTDNWYVAYITEGEKKSIFANYKLNAPLVLIPGVNSYCKLTTTEQGRRILQQLKENGCRFLVLLYDADKATNNRVLACEKGTLIDMKKNGFIVGTGEWDISDGKGIDDLLANGKSFKISTDNC